MSVMSDATRIRMVARTALVQIDTLVDEGLRGAALEALIDHAEALAVAPFARVRRDPFPHLCRLRDLLDGLVGLTSQRLVTTLDDLIARTVRVP
ncbi:hypothetical protein [Actinomycetospora soli]|uniref:hypothetical protein n=1 Tax=Actinomycetospora soli TaxID=2893887 RepID=UPI001E328234|nr:hypothetical protein [Actinomycetospora soli]MCD2191454.1 hypothetical protein [Actinomycetospora soli]